MNTLSSLLRILSPDHIHPTRSKTRNSSARTLIQRSYKVFDVRCNDGIVSIDASGIGRRQKFVRVSEMNHSCEDLRRDRDELHSGK